MWKFKVSKFKNAASSIPKREEWINDISANNLMNSCGNSICASSAYVVFNSDVSGAGNIGVLPTDSKGRHGAGNLNFIRAHSEYVTDFDFSPFDDYLLATCSQDRAVRLWQLPDKISEDITQAQWTLPRFEKKVEIVHWHPTALDILAVGCGTSVKVFDILQQKEMYDLDMHGDQIQSLSWKRDGTLLITSCKDKSVRVIDPRAQSVVQETAAHGNNKDSRVLWLGDKDYVLSTGFNKARQREVSLRDVRQFNNALTTMSLDNSSGTLMPFFDPDTNMTFLAGKGDSNIMYFELTENTPYLSPASGGSVEQIKGVCMLPKRALNVMECEVNKLFVLSKQAIIPVPYVVPRKSHTEFHGDLYPNTYSGQAAMSAKQWFDGLNLEVSKISLDPAKKQVNRFIRKCEPSASATSETNMSNQTQAASKIINANNVTAPSKVTDNNKPTGTPGNELNSGEAPKPVVTSNESQAEQPVIPREQKQHQVFSGVRHSKFRHLKGTLEHRSKHIENIRNLSRTIPGESDLFQANSTFCAVPQAGPGGCVLVLKTSERGRLPDTGIPVIQNGSLVMDFVFDPFNDHRLVVACDDAKVRVWDIPGGGLTETLSEPSLILHGHTEKIYFVRFHPLASNVLASGCYDMTVRLWNLDTGEECLRLEGHTDTIFSLAWSPDGRFCATACKDGQLRVYEPRNSTLPIKSGKGPEGSRGARVIWVCGMKYIAVSGFSKSSERVVSVYSFEELNGPLYTCSLGSAPSIMMPFYDEDSSTLFLTGRGDSMVKAYEISEEYPHMFVLADYNSPNPHQSLAFLPKRHVYVRQVEFAKVLSLTQTTIEPVSFTVPRIKKQFFQDDLFPDTKVTWEPSMTSAEWLSGENKSARTISLRPSDMQKLSEVPAEAPKPKKFESYDDYTNRIKSDDEKKEELLAAMNNKLALQGDALPQDAYEGVDSDEWED